MNRYLLNAIACGIFGLLLYLIIIVLNQNKFAGLYAALAWFVGLLLGLYVVSHFRKNNADIYSSSNFKTWMLLYVSANIFLGIFAGLLAGVLVAWFLLLPFSMVFGHPEATDWNPIVLYSFGLLSAVVVISLLKYFISWFYKGSITSLRRKIV
jgi:hypothetical protein